MSEEVMRMINTVTVMLLSTTVFLMFSAFVEIPSVVCR